MAIVKSISAETIELLRGTIDFYLLRGILPVARSWPKKPKPPYTALQAEAMAVFALANKSMRYLSENMVEEWREGSVGVAPSWTDTYRKIIMNYWKKKGSIPAIATDYHINETETDFQVVWDILQLYIPPNMTEDYSQKQTSLIEKKDLEMGTLPIYFSLYDDEGIRLVAPYILFEGKV